MPLIVKIILLGLAFVLPAPAAGKTHYFVHLSFNSTLVLICLINGISNDIQILLKYFNGTAIVKFFKIPFALSASAFFINLALY